MKIVNVLARLAGQAAPIEETWRGLWAAARQHRGSEPDKKKKSRRLVIYFVSIIVPALITSLVAPVSGNGRGVLWNFIFRHSVPASQASKELTEVLHASAGWCCTFTAVEASSGYYLARTTSNSAFEHQAGLKQSQMTPAGAGIIEIPLQTSGSDPIYVAPPKVIIRSRTQNPRTGIIEVVPLGGQGEAPPAEFTADVDAASPVTAPYGSGSDGSRYYYVSSGSPEILLLIVTDAKCDCTFDIRLTWKEQGKLQSKILTDNGQHFRIVGSSGLPWYDGNIEAAQYFRRLDGHPFSYYAPG